MDSAFEFLKKAGVFYVASAEGDQPKLRPFGVVARYKGELYICTKDEKDCFRQMEKNPKIEIAAMFGEDWIRVTGEVVRDNDPLAQKAVLDQNPHVREIYSASDPHFAVLYFKKGHADIYRSVGKIEAVPLV